MNVLVTGGLGYIGSVTVAELVDAGHNVTVVDDGRNCHAEVVAWELKHALAPQCYRERFSLSYTHAGIASVLRQDEIDVVLHLAAYKNGPGSVERPLDCYEENVSGTIRLLQMMAEVKVPYLVFASSAAVYGLNAYGAMQSTDAVCPVSPYGSSKVICEAIIADAVASGALKGATILRYFNVVGAVGKLGDNPPQPSGALFPRIGEALLGIGGPVPIHEIDGSKRGGVRDYVHVLDVARANAMAVEDIPSGEVLVENIGTGTGYDVKEVIALFELGAGGKVPTVEAPQRPSDVPACVVHPGPKRVGKNSYWTPKCVLSQAAQSEFEFRGCVMRGELGDY